MPARPHLMSRIRLTAAALIITVTLAVTGMGALYLRVETVITRVDLEARARAFVLCTNSNETRLAIRDYIGLLAVSDDQQVDVDERRALDLADTRFAPEVCPPDPETP